MLFSSSPILQAGEWGLWAWVPQGVGATFKLRSSDFISLDSYVCGLHMSQLVPCV